MAKEMVTVILKGTEAGMAAGMVTDDLTGRVPVWKRKTR